MNVSSHTIESRMLSAERDGRDPAAMVRAIRGLADPPRPSETPMPGLLAGLPDDARAAVDTWASDELAAEQYLDFLVNRTFRPRAIDRMRPEIRKLARDLGARIETPEFDVVEALANP